MKKHGVTFLNILDTSKDAVSTAYRRYRTSGVPVSYIIDRKGRVAAAWYGYSKGDLRGKEALKKLGVK